MATPQVQNQSPAPDARAIDNAANVFLEIVDADDNLTAASVIIKVNGVIAWTGDAQQAGFVVTKTVIGLGFSYDINPTATLPTGIKTRIDVFAQDGASETVEVDYTFLVEDLAFPDTGQNKGAFEDETPLVLSSGLNVPVPPKNRQNAQFEDLITTLLGPVPKFNLGTFDTWGAPHFSSASGELTVWDAFLYDSRNEPWDLPTANLFTGFAKDGTKYTAGVQDGGPVFAPWSSEAQTANRSPRDDFPDRVLLVIAQGNVGELILFDLDIFDGTAASLEVWMRFALGDASNFRMLGRINTSLQHATMRNGVLVVATEDNGPDNGAVFIVDFKTDGAQDAVQFIRSNGHERLVAAKDITNRNDDGGGLFTSTLDGGAVTLSLGSGDVYRVFSKTVQETGANRLYVVVAGEESTDPVVLQFLDMISVSQLNVSGDDFGSSNDGDVFKRSILLDRDDWLWVSRDSTIWRSANHWVKGRLWQFTPQTSTDHRRAKQQRGITLPKPIRWLASAREFILAATEDGVYAIHRGTMQVHHAFSVSAKLGQGILPTGSRAGRVMAGVNPIAYKVFGFDLDLSGYVLISTLWDGQEATGSESGGVTVVRLRDGIAVQQLEDPDIPDLGAFINVPFWTS